METSRTLAGELGDKAGKSVPRPLNLPPASPERPASVSPGPPVYWGRFVNRQMSRRERFQIFSQAGLHFSLTSVLSGGRCLPHFVDEEAEAQRGEVLRSRSRGASAVQLRSVCVRVLRRLIHVVPSQASLVPSAI